MLLGGGIRTKVGTCYYCETIEQEWSSNFLIWAATKQTLNLVSGCHDLFIAVLQMIATRGVPAQQEIYIQFGLKTPVGRSRDISEYSRDT
jgi:hypothetical protein